MTTSTELGVTCAIRSTLTLYSRRRGWHLWSTNASLRLVLFALFMHTKNIYRSKHFNWRICLLYQLQITNSFPSPHLFLRSNLSLLIINTITKSAIIEIYFWLWIYLIKVWQLGRRKVIIYVSSLRRRLIPLCSPF